ncbi:hypothetical protein E1264_12315 [Actinomadura sp. KC216]|uniref:hypothetical protein n=1 Tax=Actinomadura sp. KC216 TaxID=2530370 RepID=UPI00104FC93F|nr:hypothetical protein [Actinomadura sp. KC216]TDB88178.1 hypothetical protein E1264_12315 [Actinomadura sp. KC216]
MYEMAGMAGFFGAHGIWSVSDGETLVPLLGHEYADGRKGMERLVHEDLDDAVKAGQAALEAGQEGWVRAVLVADAYLHLEAGRFDALIVNAVEYLPERWSLQMAIPYRPESSPDGFAVYRPKFIDVVGVDEPDFAALADAFFAGVDSHEQAAATWDAHLIDESV